MLSRKHASFRRRCPSGASIDLPHAARKVRQVHMGTTRIAGLAALLVQLGLGFASVVSGCQPAPVPQVATPADAPNRLTVDDGVADATAPAASSAPSSAMPPTNGGHQDAGLCRLRPDVLALPSDRGQCDATRCAAARGSCVWGGIGCTTVCALSTADEGKRCTDRADCKGFCMTSKDVQKGAKASDTCSKTSVSFGCWNQVLKGVAGGYTCAD